MWSKLRLSCHGFPTKRIQPYCGCTKSISHHLRNPETIRFPCKYQQTLVSTMVSKRCDTDFATIRCNYGGPFVIVLTKNGCFDHLYASAPAIRKRKKKKEKEKEKQKQEETKNRGGAERSNGNRRRGLPSGWPGECCGPQRHAQHGGPKGVQGAPRPGVCSLGPPDSRGYTGTRWLFP